MIHGINMTSTKSIKFRLLGGMLLIVGFFLVQAALVWYAIEDAESSIVESTQKNTAASSELNALSIQAQQIRRYEKEYFVWVGNKTKRDGYEREWRDAQRNIEEVLKKMATGSDGAFNLEDFKKIDEWRAALDFYSAEMEKIFSAVNKRELVVRGAEEPNGEAQQSAEQTAYRPDEVNDMIKAGKDRFSAGLIKGVAAMSEAKTKDTLALADVSRSLFSNLFAGVMFTVFVGALVAVSLGVILPRMVTKTISSLSAAAKEMSMGNLKNEYSAGGVTEFTQLAEALNRMRLAQLTLVERLQKRHL